MDEINEEALKSANRLFYPTSQGHLDYRKGFQHGALYWKERSDREIAELKAEIERLKALPHKPTNSQPNNQGE